MLVDKQLRSPRIASSKALAGQDEPEYRRITDLIRQDIVEGTIIPETWLRLQGIAQQYGVSVQPVREALQVLQGEGLVEFIPNRGAKVRALDRTRIVHIYELREAMESFLAKRYAEEASLRDIVILEEIQKEHDQLISDQEFEGAAQLNRQFHRVINSKTGNEDALRICERYQGLGVLLFTRVGLKSIIHRRGGRGDEYYQRVSREHHAMIDAFRRRDGAMAMQISANHVQGTLNAHLKVLDEAMESGESTS